MWQECNDSEQTLCTWTDHMIVQSQMGHTQHYLHYLPVPTAPNAAVWFHAIAVAENPATAHKNV